MKKLLKGLGIGLVSSTYILSAPAAADSWCWDACRWDGCWEIGAEALYWRPCGTEWAFGTRDDNVLEVKPDYQWGFRILGGYYSCSGCTFLTLDWIYLKPTDTKKLNRPFVLDGFSSSNNADSATLRVRTHYNRVNLRGGYFLYRGCDISFYMFGGIRWLELKSRRTTDAVNASQQADVRREQARYWGVGIETGVGADYNIGCDFHLAGYIAGTTALGENRFNHRATVNGVLTSETRVASRTSCLPGVDFRLGINYTHDCFCVSIKGEIGYELNYYFNALRARTSGSTSSNVDINCVDVGFAGPYLSLKLCF